MELKLMKAALLYLDQSDGIKNIIDQCKWLAESEEETVHHITVYIDPLLLANISSYLGSYILGMHKQLKTLSLIPKSSSILITLKITCTYMSPGEEYTIDSLIRQINLMYSMFLLLGGGQSRFTTTNRMHLILSLRINYR